MKLQLTMQALVLVGMCCSLLLQMTQALECKDDFQVQETCRKYARPGKCRNERRWLLQYCRKSCGACHESNCKDKDWRCGFWKSMGYCKNPLHSAWISSYCPNSCGTCPTAGNPMKTKPTTTTTTTTTTTRRTPKRARKPFGGKITCSKADNKGCGRYKAYKSKYCGAGWVARNCAEMCGHCTSKKIPGNPMKTKPRPRPTTTTTTRTTTTTTMRRTPKRTRKPSGGKRTCSKADKSGCGRYKAYKKKYCGGGWVKRNCAEMCGFCTSKKLPVCSKADHSRCNSYKAYKGKYCVKGWVKNNCAKMCGVCR